jgi:hypothetical protein
MFYHYPGGSCLSDQDPLHLGYRGILELYFEQAKVAIAPRVVARNGLNKIYVNFHGCIARAIPGLWLIVESMTFPTTLVSSSSCFESLPAKGLFAQSNHE